jgi:hypothetical protein
MVGEGIRLLYSQCGGSEGMTGMCRRERVSVGWGIGNA